MSREVRSDENEVDQMTENPTIRKWPEDEPEKYRSLTSLRDELDLQEQRKSQLTSDQTTLRCNEILYKRVEDVFFYSSLSFAVVGLIFFLTWAGDMNGFRAIFGMAWALFLLALDIGMMISRKKVVEACNRLRETNYLLRRCRERIDDLKRAIELTRC